MKALEMLFAIEVALGSDFWRSTATEDVWANPVAYLESRGIADADQRQLANRRRDVECATSSSVITIVN